MFKVPDWEEDVPKNNLNLGKKINKKQPKLVVKLPPSPKKLKIDNVKEKQTPNDNKSTAKKRKHNGSIVSNKKKKENEKIDVSNIDTDKIDKVLLNAKKKKFYEPLKKDDKEHVLFKEESNKPKETAPTNKISTNGRKVAKIIDKKHKTKNKEKLAKKKKNVPEPENIPIKKVFQVKTNVETESNDNYVNDSQKVNRKKEKLKALLQMNNNRNSITVRGNKLRERMLDRLKAAQFRYINEKLYTSTGSEAKELFQSDPAAFHTYHQGYQLQVKKWPVNPLDVIVKRILKMPKTYLISDMGCGEAALSGRVPHSVRSFDLVGTVPHVEICDVSRTPLLTASVDVTELPAIDTMPKTHVISDMGCGEAALSGRVPHSVRSFDLVGTVPHVEICDVSRTPLLTASVDVTVYCLSLMGTELTQYLLEANRVLKMGGHLLIAEVESRFTDVDAFTKDVCRLGFKLKKLDKQHQVFFFMEFLKTGDPPAKKNKLPVLTLKPCLYKKR